MKPYPFLCSHDWNNPSQFWHKFVKLNTVLVLVMRNWFIILKYPASVLMHFLNIYISRIAYWRCFWISLQLWVRGTQLEHKELVTLCYARSLSQWKWIAKKYQLLQLLARVVGVGRHGSISPSISRSPPIKLMGNERVLFELLVLCSLVIEPALSLGL